MAQLNGASEQAPPRTALPESLRAGMHALSGVDLSQVQVHYNSSKPAQLQALAYAQGNDIHLGPGQERHLPHEAWHLVQQRQGRVRANSEAGGVAINDNPELEREADHMGTRATQKKWPAQLKGDHAKVCTCAGCTGGASLQLKRAPPSPQGPVHQLAKCDHGHEDCHNPNHFGGGRAPTGRYKNTTGHHDPTIDKSRKKAVKKGYTGKRGKKPKTP
ncbi:MAG TPA: DUF4157 domain-containing protein [Ideonella sp.]|uniref:eCIS core domain-containing protein n=1 Tax=Ideonella sp. TaxID=1929293 RepID=UPI002E30CCA9|nr:DUF4157 domain-containing protein [Ideonella sp.]HEX5683410.1 DUF4157 domain-containing protein [Ideonella sp.]